MNGVAVIRQLLIADSAVTNIVPASRIQGDALPQSVSLPAIAIQSISGVPRNTLPAGAKKHIRERVQVTALSEDYPSLLPLWAAILSACSDKFPTVSGISQVSVLADLEGPDGLSEGSMIRAKPQDFIVHYNRTM